MFLLRYIYSSFKFVSFLQSFKKIQKCLLSNVFRKFDLDLSRFYLFRIEEFIKNFKKDNNIKRVKLYIVINEEKYFNPILV